MALRGTTSNPHRLNESIVNAYARVLGNCRDIRDSRYHEFDVAIYYSEEDRDGDSPAQPVETKGYTISGDDYDIYFGEDVLKVAGNSTRTQQYAYLKTLPEWAGWVDC